MGKKLYVGNISFQATEDSLRESFANCGEVESVKIITDAYTGQSKGFGFIEMASEEDAKKAITDLNGTTFMDRVIVVNEARPQQPRERKAFGRDNGNYGRGGFGSGNPRGRR
ncbi:MAG: RNA-binding protein [Nitrospiraceae bacterium]|nr:MAG: RNA-binding protein [Nitrospiraceae bacterium]